MNETDYNARLYEKMKAEQDKYRDWLVRQEPSEILEHTYEYTMREDIVMCMEDLELEPEKARALLRSPCPLSDVYKEFRDRETEHKYNKDGNVPIDIIARAEDASKIQRIFDRFELGNVDKGSIVANAEKSIAEREERVDEVPTKTRGERIVEEAMGDPVKKEGQSHENPTVAKTEKSPPSERSSEIGVTASDRGAAKQVDKKPSVREKLERYKAAAKADKEADRAEPALSKEKAKAPEPLRQTVHHQPKRTKKPKAR